jgi:uncharacterized protein YggE
MGAFFALVLSGPVEADASSVSARKFTVTGYGKVTVVPDIIRLSIEVEMDLLAGEYPWRTMENTLNELVDLSLEHGVKNTDIIVSNLEIEQVAQRVVSDIPCK